MDIPGDLLQQFIRITQAQEPLASQLLRSNGLDLEASIQSFFAIQDALGHPPSAGDANAVAAESSAAPQVSEPVVDLDRHDAVAAALRETQPLTSNFPAEAPVRAPIPDVVDTLLPQPIRRREVVQDPFLESDGTARGDELARLFRPPTGLNFTGSMDLAMNAGQNTHRWLLVNIQRSDIFACHILNRDVWSDAALQDLLRVRFIFWQRDEKTDDGRRYKHFYPYREPPHVAILDPRSGEQLRVWGGEGETIRKDELIRGLADFSERNSLAEGHTPAPHASASRARSRSGGSSAPREQRTLTTDDATNMQEVEDAEMAFALAASMAQTSGSDLVANGTADENGDEVVEHAADPGPSAEHQRRETSRLLSASNPSLNMDRSLRAQQDSEYEASLAVDRAIQESQRAETERVQRLQELKEVKRRRVPPEPPASEKNTTRLVIRLPSGGRLQRRFMPTDTIGNVYDFLETESDEVGDEEYDLSTPYPKKSYTDRSMTLVDAGLHPSTLLVVHRP